MNADEIALEMPASCSEEPAVGHYFAAPGFERMRTEIYLCDSYDAETGYVMVNMNAPTEHRRVSTGAIGRTWVAAADRGHYWWVPLWRLKIEKADLV